MIELAAMWCVKQCSPGGSLSALLSLYMLYVYYHVLYIFIRSNTFQVPHLLFVQVKFFQSEDCPSAVGREPPGNPHERVSNANITIAHGCPGSSVGSYPNLLSHKGVSHIPQIPWRTPPRVSL